MGLYKIFKIVAAIIGVLATVFFVMILVKGGPEIEATGEGVQGFINFGYIVLALITLITLVFALKGLLAGDIKKTLITVIGFVVIAGLGYALAGNEVLPEYLTAGPVTEGESKWVGAGLYAFYFMAFIAVVVTVFGGVKKLIGK